MIRPLILFAIASIAAPAGAQSRKPNFLFLFADDMRADSIAALGNRDVKTPHLDALVQRGFTFTNAYCFGGNLGAVCTPSRNMLLSGNAYFRWKEFTPPGMPNRQGTLAPGDGPNLPLSLKAAGYWTYHHGKRGNTAPLIQAKFDVNEYLKNDDAERKSGEPGREIVDSAILRLKNRGDDRPFAMYLAFGNPHDPRIAARKYLDQYDPKSFSLLANRRPIHPFDNGELTVRDEQLLPWPRTDADLRMTLHDYYATITAMDFHIGRLIDYLRSSGQLDNTLIVFSADQGIAVGSHGLLGKQNLYDHSMKVPLVFAGPGIRKGSSAALCHLFDIYPTLVDLAGSDVPASIDGRSLKPLLDGTKSIHREAIMLAYMDKQRAIRDERWKMIRYPQVNITQLFDLQNDPGEETNLADRPESAPRVEFLTSRLVALQKQFDDSLALTSTTIKPAKVTAEELTKRVRKK